MSQIEYDIVEFCLSNKKELKQIFNAYSIDEITSMMPWELYRAYMEDIKLDKLKIILSEHNFDIENINLTVDATLVNIIES